MCGCGTWRRGWVVDLAELDSGVSPNLNEPVILRWWETSGRKRGKAVNWLQVKVISKLPDGKHHVWIKGAGEVVYSWLSVWVLSWGTFPWLWPKDFCLSLYVILWNVCPSALGFLPSHRDPFSRSGWADTDLLFLAACSEGAAVEEETSPYLLQNPKLWRCRLLSCQPQR